MSMKGQRIKAGFTQQKTADALCTTRVTVARWEGGVSEPDHKTLKRLCALYDCTLDALLFETDLELNPPQPSAQQPEEPGAEAECKKTA